SKQDQKCTIAWAVCALLNSGGGVVKAEIENENYNLERDKIGLDMEETFWRDMDFTESGDVEFKRYSTETFLTRVKEILPQHIAGLANTSSGHLWIGVDDDSRVQGFNSDAEDLEILSLLINSIQSKLTLFHFRGSGNTHNVRYDHKIFEVSRVVGDHCGYVRAVKIQPFTCVPFSKDLDSWLVEGSTLRRLRQLSEGVLIFSRSWALEVTLPENQDIICDVLLVAKDRPPILCTICKHHFSKDLSGYSRCIAWKLKEKLVDTGGYIHKLCVIPKLLTLHPNINCGKGWDLNL
ncbi:PREDICTED: schlafen family member 12-like, partial [Leptosomus discolor]|uniref:schlafen family member 12-like n=1 Tax=Leptosomus discolor TaxID=188344 RepID=UPI000522CC93